ncbi:hypothetical protein Tco_0820838 [Tanacetum coccineum]|uniref:Reverse transcriptase domain-containing protein n=1 Tax=Tanacetum coccineum TaxID=301880 RepID=A0ABQ5AEU9_9ASTR
MHQPWRTLEAIINRCLLGKTSSNDRLRPSRIENLCGIYHKADVDNAALIWEDLQYQINNKQSKVRRREIMPYPRFTKVIIHHFMSQHKSISKRHGSPYHTVDNDGVLDRLKFISKGEEHQTFIAISTSSILPMKGRGKGAQGIKATVIPKNETVASKKKPAKKKDKGAGITPEVPDKPTGKSAVSDEGAGTSLETLIDDKDEKVEDIPWVSTDEDESDDDDEEDDESIDIETTDDETTDTDVEDQNKRPMKNKADEEQQGYDQAGDEQVGVLVSTTHKEKPNLLQSTSSHSVSSNFSNQFLNSPNVSLIGTIQANAEVEINSLLDIQIQQDVPNIQQELFHVVKVVSDLEKDVKELKQVYYTPTILESIKYEVPEAVNKYLGSTLRDTLQKDDVSKFIKVKQELAAKEKMSKFLTTPYDQVVEDEHKQKDILFQMMMASKSHEKHPAHKELYDALIQLLLVDKNDMDRLVVDPASQRKRRHDDKDQDPPAGSDQGMKKRRTGKDAEPSKKSLKSKESAKGKTQSNTSKTGKSVSTDKPIHEPEHIVKMDVEEPHLNNVANDADKPQADSWFNEMIQAEKPSLTFDELMSTLIDFSAFAMNRLKLNKITKADLVGPMFNLLKGTCKSCVKLEYNMEECYRALTDQLDWTNPEGHKSPVDMSNPLPLQDKEGRLIIPVEFFFNSIEDMIPTQWSPVKISYDKDDALRISHWGPQHQQFYRAMINKVSKHEVFRNMRISSVVSVQMEKKSSYGYLKEIIVRRADQKLYKFKECDFQDLHLNDIEDMLRLIAQNKLFNLEGDVIVDFVTALKMFTRGIIFKNRVEDVQLEVESYQRKLSLTKPQRTCPHISVKESYTLNFDPPGVIYEEKSKKKRLMRVDEIHKFCDGTLQSIHNILHERLLNFKFGYNKGMPSREWTTKDKRRTCIMLNKIDDQLFKRLVLRSLEVLVGGRKTETDKRLLQRTVGPHGTRGSCKDAYGDTLFQQIQVHNRMLILKTFRRDLRVIRDMYEEAKRRVWTTLGNTEFFPVEVGDVVLVAESAEGLNNRLESLREVLEDNGLMVSREKTQYLRCDFNRSEIAHNKEVEVHIEDHILQPIEPFRFWVGDS